jgi:hypothetical protein
MSETVGQVLRATREAKGQTLEDVERVTRIRVRHLAALEADQFATLPSTAHARGFLKNYAQHLGLDSTALLAAYEVQVQKRPLLSLRPAPTRPAPIVQGPSRPKLPPRVVTPAAPTRAPVPGKAPQVRLRRRPRLFSADVLFAIVITALMVALLAWGGTQLATTLGAEATATVSLLAGLNTPDPAAATAAALATPTERPAPTVTALPPTPAGAFSGVNVTVSAELRTWVSVKVDGAEVFAGILAPGESRDYVGLSVVEVATGNGRGTRVIFNGVDQGLLGELGEVAIRLWTESGMLFPTETPVVTVEG